MKKALPSPNALSWLFLSLVLVVLDQASKWFAVARLQFEQPVPFVDGFWNWTLTHNRGAAFSFLADAGGWQHWLFVGLACLVSAALVAALRHTPRSDWRNALPFAMVISGALGNVVDRVRFGYVVDFVQWYWRDFHWPVFNLADSCIVVGAALLVIGSLWPAKQGAAS